MQFAQGNHQKSGRSLALPGSFDSSVDIDSVVVCINGIGIDIDRFSSAISVGQESPDCIDGTGSFRRHAVTVAAGTSNAVDTHFRSAGGINGKGFRT